MQKKREGWIDRCNTEVERRYMLLDRYRETYTEREGQLMIDIHTERAGETDR